jgi:hypothetical protein
MDKMVDVEGGKMNKAVGACCHGETGTPCASFVMSNDLKQVAIIYY